MLENRSFDHMLGFMKRGGKLGNVNVDGLDGKEYNLKNVSDPSSEKVYVNDLAIDECPYDPSHEHTSTTAKIYGCDFNGGNNPCSNDSIID